MKTFARTLLRRARDFVDSDRHEHKPKHIEQQPDGIRVAWVTLADQAAMVSGRWHGYRFQRVVVPLADPNKKAAERDKQDVGVRYAMEFDGEGSDDTRCAECGERVIPIIYLEPGLKLVQLRAPGAIDE